MAKDTINKNPEYWLEEIKKSVDNVATASATAVQSDWNEATSTAASYIKNKPTIPQGALIVEGEHSDAFYVESQQVIDGIEDAIAAGRPVYLHDATNLGYALVQGVNKAGEVYYSFMDSNSLVSQLVMVAEVE